MIRKASFKDLAAIKQLTETCAAAMQQKGIYQWNEHYPSLERLSRDIELEELFILKDHKQLLGIIVLTSEMDEEYDPISWSTPSKNNLYVHRLATSPCSWGNGNGSKLMDFAEDSARQKAYNSVRLDTFSGNLRNQRFYERRGYQRLGHIYFPKQSTEPFFCYEKLLG